MKLAPFQVKSVSGSSVATVNLDESIFGVQPNVPLMHQVVTAQLAARRAGTQSTLTRAEVRGGGAKPFRQKGTGRGRQGSIRAPHWVGGGVSMGPKPRKYLQKTPKKMIRAALASALSDRANEDNVIILNDFGWNAPSTKAAQQFLVDHGLTAGRTLIVLNDIETDAAVALSFRNLQHVHVLLARELNAYDVLVADRVVFTLESLPSNAPAADEAAASLGGSTSVTLSTKSEEA
jgi:large subunit ribosomal protein L4